MSKFVKSRIWPAINYSPHDHQRIIHGSQARHRVGCAGRRFGKSQVGGHELTIEALRTYGYRHALADAAQRREFWIVGPEYTDSEKEFRVLWDDLKRLDVPLDKPGSYNNTEGGEMVVSLWDKRFLVHAKSAKYPSSLVGEGLSGVVMAEAAKLKEIVWTKYIRPTLADFKGWSLWLSTPEGKNWYHGLWQRGNDPNYLEWESWRLPSWFNPYVFPKGATDEGIAALREWMSKEPLTPAIIERTGVDEEVVAMMLEMTEERFNQEVGADFSEFVGRVFKAWDEETHVTDLQYNPRWPLYACMDYGWTNPFVCLLIQVDVWDNVSVIGEYRTKGTDIEDIARELNAWKGGLIRKAVKFYPDPEAPGDSAMLTKHLGIPFDAGTGGELKVRLEYIRKFLKPVPEHVPPEERVPKLLVDRSCKGMPLGDGGLIREMGDYRYADTKEEQDKENPENPLKKDDHGPEALGRFFRGHYGLPQDDQKGSRARVRTARVSA